MWQEAVAIYYDVIFPYLPVLVKNNHYKLSHESRSQDGLCKVRVLEYVKSQNF
jgi:hypothetical protein